MQFPGLENLFDMLMGEMPEGVYATDRADKFAPDTDQNSYSSAEIRAWAEMEQRTYVTLLQIYNNKFVTSSDIEGLERWEQMIFGKISEASLGLEVRRHRLLDQLRYIGGINFAAIDQKVSQVLSPMGLAYTLVTLSGSQGNGAWILGKSKLGINTYTAHGDPLRGAVRGHELDCSLSLVGNQLTADRLVGIQRAAYSFQVRISGNADAETIQRLDDILTIFEAGRSTHEIYNNFPGAAPDAIDGGTFSISPYGGIVDGGRFRVGAVYDLIDGGAF